MGNFLSNEEAKRFLSIQKQGHIFLKDDLIKLSGKNDFKLFLSRGYFKDIYKNKIFGLVTERKTIENLFGYYHEKILSMIGKIQFGGNYSMGYKYSLYKHINKFYNFKLEDIVILTTRKKSRVYIEDIGEIKCNFKETIDGKYVNYGKESIQILNQYELFLYLFGRNIYQNGEFSEKDLSMFLQIVYFDKEKLINELDGNSYKKHILKNSLEIYKKYNITNNFLFDIYKHFGLLSDEDKEKNKYGYTKRDYSGETGDIVRHKKMIDEIIEFSIEFEKKLKNELSVIETFSTKEIINNINKNSSNDIYHSTTIEGYKINKDDVIYINEGILPDYINKNDENTYSKKIQEIGIIKSYKRTLEMVISEYLGKKKILSKNDLLKLNYYEFIEFHESRGEKLENYNYRNHQVRMDGCDGYLPVENISKIDILVDYLLENINKIENHLIRGIALHFLMVPIQPFGDGNGRLSRFLMNITFSNGGYKWCTIDKHDYRREFLSSYGLINEGKYDELLKVYIRFISFIFGYFQFKFNKKDLLNIK